MNEYPILDVPDIRTLEFSSAEEQVAEFRRSWGLDPVAVALPVVAPDGIPFENDLIPPIGVKYAGRTDLMYLGGVAYEFAKLGLNVMLTVNPQLSFLRSASLQIIDISGDSAAQACLGKPRAKHLLVRIIGEALNKVGAACEKAAKDTGKAPQLEALALDIENLWPMGAENERIELTCFCQECRGQLASLSKTGGKLVKAFERFPNPWNFLLKDSGDGISPISDFDHDVLTQTLLDISHMKGFDEILADAERDLVKEAEVLIDYVHTRHSQTVGIIASVFQSAAALPAVKKLKRILIVEGNKYDWTEGVFFSRLDDPTVCDELWFDPSERALNTTRVVNRSYMQRRCRYQINAFFDFLSRCQDEHMRTVTKLADVKDAQLRWLLELRRRQAVSSRLASRLDLLCLHERSPNDSSGRIGFVGSNLSESLSQTLVRNARIISTGPEISAESHTDPVELIKALLKKEKTSY